ncbi:putative homoserine kinase type II (protein kinase fold) [Belliella baltica DSM 15883]|uniref:Putative homoserine kinase type II (Protein kinase fold) n=1 Tax=Belliella baltica (strain DSM 15883 / CIP 108006 / LMG 21964 / BA134) TaxID=866536 RepID=I3Z2K4_BELBD|nr:aminoglycoside phosphotransferase family protein [Belliella baltica]AFL83472.1 putative homoserine kinase type II (protein kinase fold) [Belliella baltica DSM 15883]
MPHYSFLSTINQAYGKHWTEDQIQVFGNGHIHQTFLVTEPQEKHILQIFNKGVFENPEFIVDNHQILRKQLPFEKLPYQLPLPVENLNGRMITTFGEQVFRVQPYIKGICLEDVKNPKQAFLAAEAFAQFTRTAKNLDVSDFKAVIPRFLDLEWRYQQFTEALDQKEGRLGEGLKELIEFYTIHKSFVEEYRYWVEKLPIRLTHNDCKINNLIFSEDQEKVVAVIDLDTIMPGYVFYDFGDLVRTVACTEGENSTQWDQINVDKLKYEALYEGYTSAGEDFLTKEELNSLNYGGKMMTYISGLRFLTDYLKDNVYFPVQYPEQNFDRARNQMMLLKSLNEYFFQLKKAT